MTTLGLIQVRRRLMARGLSRRQAQIGAAIALCEAPTYTDPPRSNFEEVGDEDLANETWGYSYGGFQIRSLREQRGTGGIRDADRLLDPKFNIDSAVAIFRGAGWEPWSTFTSGMYKVFLPAMFPPPAGTYVVMPGDTLGSIAQELGYFTWQDLARENGLHSPYRIYIGQQLRLPSG